MLHRQSLLAALIGLACALATPALLAQESPRSLSQARQAITQPSVQVRLAGIQRLGEIGTMPDADRLVASLRDETEQVRLYASVSMWQTTHGRVRCPNSRPMPMVSAGGRFASAWT